MFTFEQNLRREIVNAAYALHKSGMSFAVFTKSKCNPDYWTRTSNGGWSLKPGANPADAIRDIFDNGWAYATECATAMVIVYYKAVLEVYGDDLFNKTIKSIYLMDWDVRDPLFAAVGSMNKVPELIPGDRGYFANPDHSPDLPQWQGENVIVLGDGRYYGHGIGINTADHIMNALNSKRGGGNPRPAYLMNSAGRPDFARLERVMTAESAITVWREFPPAFAPIRKEAGKGKMFV